MLKPANRNGRIRHSFGKIYTPVEPPNLLAVQLDSYNRFLQKDLPPDQRANEGHIEIMKLDIGGDFVEIVTVAGKQVVDNRDPLDTLGLEQTSDES